MGEDALSQLESSGGNQDLKGAHGERGCSPLAVFVGSSEADELLMVDASSLVGSLFSGVEDAGVDALHVR